MYPLSLASFTEFLETELALETAPAPTTSFIDDLDFDSVSLYELICCVEDLGVELPYDVLADVKTVEQIHSAYVRACSQAEPGALSR
jgi:acyl carrier protein